MAECAKPRVLFVDDEPELLAALVRTLRSEHFEVSTAASGAAALEMLRHSGAYAVIVSDLRMPEMDGVSLLRRARKVAPDTVRVLFTGQPDLERAIAAVNEGEIFRFVTKPCSRVPLALLLKSAVEQHQLLTAERVLLEHTLRGSIQALTDVLGLANPVAFGRANRLRQVVSELISFLGISVSWHIEVAAMLSQIGCVTLSPMTLEKVYGREALSAEEEEAVRRLPFVAEEVLGNIPRLEPVLEILRYQEKHFDGTGVPCDHIAGEAIPWGARALKVALDFDMLESEGISMSLVFDTLRGRAGWYDPVILEALAEIHKGCQRADVRELPLSGLRPGMIFAQDLKTERGTLFVARGQEVTAGLLEKLRNFATHLHGEEAIRVVVRSFAERP